MRCIEGSVVGKNFRVLDIEVIWSKMERKGDGSLSGGRLKCGR